MCNTLAITNSEHRELNDLKTIVEIIDWLDERFILKREGEDGYGIDTTNDGVPRRLI